MPNMTTSNNNPWLLDKTIAANEEYNNVGRFHASLSTAGSLLDRNIELDIDTVAVSGTIGGSATAGTATAVINNVNTLNATTTEPSGTAGSDYWEIKATATGTAGGYTPKYTVSSAGWLHDTVTGSQTNVSVTADSTGKSLYIPKATFTVNGSSIAVNTAGYITSGTTVGTSTPLTFANTATNNVTYTDISNTAPMLISGDYLYVNAGYSDNVKISLSKLVPDWDTTLYPNVAAENHILSGYVAYDEAGSILTGTIPSKAAATYNASLSDRTISSGQYLSGDQLIRGIVLTNIASENIKYGVTISVGDTDSSTRLTSRPGSFTRANTSTATNGAASANQILSGYSAWVDGAEVKGNIANGTGITFNENVATAAAGYYASAATATMTTATITSGVDSITSGPTYTYNSTNSNFDVSIGTSIAAPSVGTAGFISSTKGTRNTNTNTLTTTVAAAAATISASQQASTPTISRTTTGTNNVSSGAAVTSAPSGYYVTATANVPETTFTSGNITKTIDTAGYLNAVNQITISSIKATTATSGTYYIPVASNTITGSTVDLVAPSVAITTSTSSGLNISNSATSYYVEITGTPTNGSVKGKATAGSTTGIVAAGVTHTQATATTITPTITGSGS